MNWVGEGGTLAYVHGMYTRWCEHCAVMAQIDYARKRAEELPALEAKLAALDVTEAKG